MNILDSLRENLKRIYAEYDIYLRPVIKFITAFLFLMLLRRYLDVDCAVSRPSVMLLMSLSCILFSSGFISFVCSLFIIGCFFAESYSYALFAGMLLLLIFILYYGFRPGKGIFLILVPISFILKIPFLVPLVLGLSYGVLSAIPAAFGVVFWNTLSYFQMNRSEMRLTTDPEAIIHEFLQFLGSFLKNREMFLTAGVFVLCILIVHLIRRLDIPHAWTIAIFTGTVLLAAGFLIGGKFFGIEQNVSEILIAAVLSLPLALVYELFVFHVDYKATEYLQFEDDEYYYFVKAIPKIGNEFEEDRRE